MPITQPGNRRLAESVGVACAVCGEVHARHTMDYSDALGGLTCQTCRESGRVIYDAARDAARRHLFEIRRQLPQLIRDRRAGADTPSFYQGFE
jgi:hypothetical protein